MVVLDEVKAVLKDVLQLGTQADGLVEASPLLGAIPEFDSMAVVGVITALEERLGLEVDDDEISAEIFETVGSLCDFVAAKVA